MILLGLASMYWDKYFYFRIHLCPIQNLPKKLISQGTKVHLLCKMYLKIYMHYLLRQTHTGKNTLKTLRMCLHFIPAVRLSDLTHREETQEAFPRWNPALILTKMNQTIQTDSRPVKRSCLGSYYAISCGGISIM